MEEGGGRGAGVEELLCNIRKKRNKERSNVGGVSIIIGVGISFILLTEYVVNGQMATASYTMRTPSPPPLIHPLVITPPSTRPKSVHTPSPFERR